MQQASPTEQEIYERRMQFKRDMEPFAWQLGQIIAVMPMPGFKIDMLDGSFEQLPPAKEWQDQIDRILEMRNEFIKRHYPEINVD